MELANTTRYIEIGSKLYYNEDALRINWFGASNICRQLGGFLVNLESEDELKLLNPHLHPSLSYWTSLNDLAVPGIFASSTSGRNARYLNWSAGQPDNTGGVEHCVELWRSSTSFQMNDVQCETILHFICE
ncbi:hypothetical protein KR215_011193, partial [Drosophila sulfurigaster]